MRLPDWLIYLAILIAILAFTGSWYEKNDAPPAPPPPGVGEMALFANFTPFSTGSIMNIPSDSQRTMIGTAFSMSRTGQWLVTAKTIEGCKNPFIYIGGNLAVKVKIKPIAGQANYVLGITNGGALPMTSADPATIKPGLRGFMMGYPSGEAGEATARLIGTTSLRPLKRNKDPEVVYAWAMGGKTVGLDYGLKDLAGGPTMNDDAQIVGITLMEKPRRGRIYSSTFDTYQALQKQSEFKPFNDVRFDITKRNYGIISDIFRREYRVSQVGCLLS